MTYNFYKEIVLSNSQNNNNIKAPKELNRIVGQSNEMIRKTFYSNLKINDIKLFRTIVSKINYRDSLFQDFYFITHDELNIAGISNSNRFKFVTESLEKLAATYVNILDKEGVKTRVGLIRNKFKYPKGSNQILVEIDDDLKPYLLELNGEYTKYQLSHIGKIKTIQQLKLYEILRSWAGKGRYKTTLENLRDYLEIKENTYKNYGNFKQKILDKALEIINNETDIVVELESLNTKSFKTDTLIFHIEFKNQEKVEFDITEFIDKVFIDKGGVKYLVKSYIKDTKRIGYYNLELVNLECYKITKLAESALKEELYQIVKGRIDILDTIRKAKKNKNKIENMLKGMSSSSRGSTSKTPKPFQSNKAPTSRLTDMTQQQRIDNFTKGNKEDTSL